MISVLIIDDEAPARELVKQFLAANEDVEIVGEASNGFEGHKLIQSLKPHVVLLDIQMPKLNGFEMLELLDNPPAIIFCTAYDEYAIKAFEQNAIDYLLKPFKVTPLPWLSTVKIATLTIPVNLHCLTIYHRKGCI